jgi:hypothetical protein
LWVDIDFKKIVRDIKAHAVFSECPEQVNGLRIIVAVGTRAVGIMDLEMDTENAAAGCEKQGAGEKKPF